MNNMAMLSFFRGDVKNATIKDGQLLIDKGYKQLYADVENTRYHLGGVIEVADTTALSNIAEGKYSTNSLFYVESENKLYKYNGTSFVAIAGGSASADDIAVRVEGDGNYVSDFDIVDGELVITKSTLPTYELRKLAVEPGGANVSKYQLYKVNPANGTSEAVGQAIEIGKDQIVNGGSVKTATGTGSEPTGVNPGDSYIEIELQDGTILQIPSKDLVTQYTAGDGIVINNGEIKLNVVENNGLEIDSNGQLVLTMATKTQAGAMSAVDKAKLESLVTAFEWIEA